MQTTPGIMLQEAEKQHLHAVIPQCKGNMNLSLRKYLTKHRPTLPVTHESNFPDIFSVIHNSVLPSMLLARSVDSPGDFPETTRDDMEGKYGEKSFYTF